MRHKVQALVMWQNRHPQIDRILNWHATGSRRPRCLKTWHPAGQLQTHSGVGRRGHLAPIQADLGIKGSRSWKCWHRLQLDTTALWFEMCSFWDKTCTVILTSRQGSPMLYALCVATKAVTDSKITINSYFNNLILSQNEHGALGDEVCSFGDKIKSHVRWIPGSGRWFPGLKIVLARRGVAAGKV